MHGDLDPNQLARMCCYMGLQFQMKEYEIKRKINEYIYFIIINNKYSNDVINCNESVKVYRFLLLIYHLNGKPF